MARHFQRAFYVKGFSSSERTHWSLSTNARSPAPFWPLPMSLRSFLLPLHYTLFTPTHTTPATMVAPRRWRWCICVDPHPNEKKIITPSERSRFAAWVFASVAAGRLSSPTSPACFCGMPFWSDVPPQHVICCWCKCVPHFAYASAPLPDSPAGGPGFEGHHEAGGFSRDGLPSLSVSVYICIYHSDTFNFTLLDWSWW